MQTKTVKLKTNDTGGVSLAPPGVRPGYHKEQSAFVVAIQHVPAHLPPADVLTAYGTAAIDVSFDGPYTVLWDDLVGTRPDQIVRASSGRAAQRLLAAGGTEPQLARPPRRRSS